MGVSEVIKGEEVYIADQQKIGEKKNLRGERRAKHGNLHTGLSGKGGETLECIYITLVPIPVYMCKARFNANSAVFLVCGGQFVGRINFFVKVGYQLVVVVNI